MSPVYVYRCPRCGVRKEVPHSMSLAGRLNLYCADCAHEGERDVLLKREYTPPTIKVEGGTT